MEKRFMTITEVMNYLTLGKNKADSFCEVIGAKRKIGKRSLYDRQRIDNYFDGEDMIYIPIDNNKNN